MDRLQRQAEMGRDQLSGGETFTTRPAFSNSQSSIAPLPKRVRMQA